MTITMIFLPNGGRALRLSTLVVAAVLALTVLSTSAAAASAAAAASVRCTPTNPAPSEGGVDMSATILGPETSVCDQTPSGASSGAGSTGGSGSSSRPTGGGGSGSGSTVTPGIVDTDAETPVAAPDEVDLGGVLNVGGLSSSYVPSPNPLGGDLEVSFTVRNVSQSTIDARADFWMQSPFGNRISSADRVSVAGLKPGETRAVSATLPAVGQWTILTAHATFTPPETIDGTELSPLTRDMTVFAFPWFIALLTVVGLAAWLIVQILRRREVVEPIGALA